MIPKVIHYVWLSNDTKPSHIQRCINSWKSVMPDYQIRLWTMEDFDFSKMPTYVQEALSLKKWAFVTDYLRLLILFEHGGCYLDSDVLMVKSFEDLFVEDKFYSFIEYHPEVGDGVVAIQAAALASNKNNSFVKSIIDEYQRISFIQDDGSIDPIIAPDRYADCAKKIGFICVDELQNLQDDVTIFPSKYLGGGYRQKNKEMYGIHLGASSWRGNSLINKIKNEIKYLLILGIKD